MAEVTGHSKIMFVLAHPVGHVRASAIMNAHFAKIGLDVAVSPIDIRPEDLEQMIKTIAKMQNVAGFGVTMPHKTPVMPFLTRLTANAKTVGAVNFVRRDPDGSLIGHNTDGLGFVAGLIKSGLSVKGKRVFQMGAGGAGRAVAFSIAQAGAATLHIANRSEPRAKELADAVNKAMPSCKTTSGPATPADFDFVVNTTSLGMKPDDALPFDITGIKSSTVVAEVIVNPPFTKLLELAKEKGCQVVSGKLMLDEQMHQMSDFVFHGKES